MWESVHGDVHYNRWHPPAELFCTINRKDCKTKFHAWKNEILIFITGCYA